MNNLTRLIILSLICLSNLAFAKANSEPNLREKIGQMLIVGFDGKVISEQSPIVKDIQKLNIGGVILFDFNYTKSNFDKNIESPSQVKLLNKKLQTYNYQAKKIHHLPKLPLLISIDYEGGKVSRLGKIYGFPDTISAREVAKKPVAQAELSAKNMATTLKSLDFNLDFAPVVDLDLNQDNSIIRKKERSFSADPLKVAEYAEIYSRAFLSQKIQCAYKHFPGHGSAKGDSHLGFVDVSNSWKNSELKPYEILLNSNHSCGMVMIAHVVNRKLDKSGFPASLSHEIITKLLRKQLNFKGLVITDDMQMKAISDNYGLEQALVLSINAGSDMLIFGNNLTVNSQDTKQLIDLIESKVINGEISKERIEEAYQHIVAFKKTLK